MRVVREIENYVAKKPCAVVLGNFDGFHLGHKAITDKVLELSAQLDLIPAVVTFEPHPMKYFGKDLKLIMTEESKLKAFAEAGVDTMFVLEFSKKFAEIDPEAFVKEYLVEKLKAKAVVVGYDYHFGKGRSGDYSMLVELGEKYGFEAVQVPKVSCDDGTTVSSTNIRNFLLEGDVKKAGELLGRPYFIEGVVVDGNKVGRTLGFPTANIDFRNELLPKAGIYTSLALLDGVKYQSVTNLGIRPTLDLPHNIKVETHFFDFNRDIYGKELTVELLEYIRPEEKFENLEKLKEAIAKDCDIAKKWLSENI